MTDASVIDDPAARGVMTDASIINDPAVNGAAGDDSVTGDSVRQHQVHRLHRVTAAPDPASRLLTVLLPAAVSILLPVLVSLAGGFYYDLNDDSMMAAILSGDYTGTPALRNIQSYYPLTAVLGGLYRICPAVDWYGLFLTALPFVCLYLVLHRIATITVRQGRVSCAASADHAGPSHAAVSHAGPRKASGCPAALRGAAQAVIAVLLFVGLMLYHLVFVQYSVVVGIMAATSAFLFLTMEPEASPGGWIREILPQLILIWLGFLLRSEMLLFVSPLIALAFLIRLAQINAAGQNAGHKGEKEDTPGKRPGDKPALVRAAVLTLALVLAGLAAGWAGNSAGYSSQEWREFYELFDARTQLYDYEKLPDYEENEAFYMSLGLDEAEADLIANYNFGIDDRIDAQVLQEIADYAHEKAAMESGTAQRLKEALWDYRASFTSESERPYNIVCIVLYVLAAAAAAAGWRGETSAAGHRRGGRLILRLAELAALFAIRSGLLLYLYYNNRPVERLTHSVYLIEAVILVWMILEGAGGRILPADRGTRPEESAVGRGTCPEESAAGHATAGCGNEKSGTGKGETAKSGIRKCKAADDRPERRPAAGVNHTARILFTAVILLLLGYAMLVQVRTTGAELAHRETVNVDWTAFMEYCESNPENVYFTDVYSTVGFSEKIFDSGEALNYDLMGGWVSKSPLEEDKFEALGLTGENGEPASAQVSVMETSLSGLDNCYYAAASDTDTEWLAAYYECRGTAVEISAVDTVGTYWTIYSVKEILP